MKFKKGDVIYCHIDGVFQQWGYYTVTGCDDKIVKYNVTNTNHDGRGPVENFTLKDPMHVERIRACLAKRKQHGI